MDMWKINNFEILNGKILSATRGVFTFINNSDVV
jgi:hypothetical protein